MKLKKILFILLVVPIITFGQQKISGVVTSADDGTPLPGASVVVNSDGVVTDFDGNYTIEGEIGDEIIISFVGYLSQTIVINGTTINVSLQTNSLDEVVVTGYGTEKKSDITGAITVVEVEELQSVATPNIITKLQSRVPGLSFTSSGVPGGNDTQISIRGLTSLFGGVGPLWVIDGVQTSSPAGLNSNEIESVQVLKDAASAGIYGTEAARGVIIVTTKKAKEGKTKVTFDSSVTLNTVREDFSVLGAQDWLDVRYAAQGNSAVTAGNFTYIPGNTIPEFLDANNNLRTSNTNWIDVILNNSISSRTDLSYATSKNNWKIFSSLGYASDNGIMEHTYFRRVNFRLNSSVDLLDDKLTIGQNLTVVNFNEVKGNSMEDAILQNPLIPIYGEDGTWGGPTGGGLQDKWNPLAILYINKDNQQKTWRTFGNFYADYQINDDFKISTKINYDFNSFSYDEKTGAFNQNGSILGNRILAGDDVVARFNVNRNQSSTYIWSNILTYNKTIGQHSLNAFLGQEIFKRDQENTFNRIEAPYGEAVDYENLDNYTILQDSSVLDAYGIGADSRRESYFTRIAYNYDEKYFATASLRRDGSSRFGRNNRYAIFPTASVGWTLTKEDFLTGSEKINNLKLRLSWGGNGNADILEYAQYSIFNQALENSNYDLSGGGSGQIGQGVSPNQVGNPDLKWEQSYQTNFGIDANLFNNTISVVLDVYQKDTSDMLLQIVQPSVLGEAGKTLFFNAGNMTNTGIDAAIGYHPTAKGNFSYGVDLTFSAYDNEVTALSSDDDFILNGVSYTAVGHPIGSYYGFVADGIFRTPEEVAVHAQQPGKDLGNIRYRDLNGDGVVNQDDRTVIGNPHPDFIYGMNFNVNYNQWGVNLFFDGRYGNEMYNAQRELLDFPYFGFNHGLNTLDAWSSTNANALVPRLTTSNPNDQRRPSTYFVEDGSFFRLKTLNVSYDLKESSISNLGLSAARVYLQAENLLNFTPFSGFDYEVPGLSRTGIGIAGLATYPHLKSFSLGLNLTF